MPEPRTPIIVGADVGGTFTDLVATHDGTVVVAKVPSTPADPGIAIITGLEQLCAQMRIPLSSVDVLLHGTTVATNAVLERRGAMTALLTTRGFRDVLEIARQDRPRLFDFDAGRSRPLISRDLRVEVGERMSARGEPVEALDREQLAAVMAQLVERGVESVAVSFLHSYANPDHERAAAEEIRSRWPELHVSLSSEVIPEYREYERTSTTALNAFVAPVMQRYLSALAERLAARDAAEDLRIMQSNGGLMTVGQAVERPASTALSGVAAGALGGVRIAHRAGRRMALTLDMGGTSCDLALGIDGEVRMQRSYEVGDLPVRLPALDVHTIGAGGGSIAHLDSGGALRVGPRSAGASPGPACYQRGGVEPTVTDANLVLGRLPVSGLIGGELPLDADLAQQAVQPLADRLGLSLEETALGIVRVVNAGMARQMRVLTVERGIDPRECTLVAFGGGGPVHAAALAAELGIRDVLVPPSPGVTSGLGLLLSEGKHDRVKTVLLDVGPDPASRERCAAGLRDALDELRAYVHRDVGDVADVAFVEEVELRYRRQGHELCIPVPRRPIDVEVVDELERDFHRAHRERFGFAVEDEPLRIVNALVTATTAAPLATTPRLEPERAGGAEPSARPVYFDDRWHESQVVPRERLVVDEPVAGPVIVEQLDSTTVVPPGATVVRDGQGNLIVRLDG